MGHGDTAAKHTDLQSGCGPTCVFAVRVWSNLLDLIWLRTSHYSMITKHFHFSFSGESFNSFIFDFPRHPTCRDSSQPRVSWWRGILSPASWVSDSTERSRATTSGVNPHVSFVRLGRNGGVSKHPFNRFSMKIILDKRSSQFYKER